MKAKIIIISAILLTMFSGLALGSIIPIQSDYTTQEAKAGDYVHISITNQIIETSGLPIIGIITGGWKPDNVKWYLVDPEGNTVYMKDVPCYAVETGGFLGTSAWRVTSDAGLIKLPAFAKYGMWTVRAKFYDSGLIGQFIFDFSKDQSIMKPILVGQSGWENNLGAPLYVYWNISGFEISFGTPDLVFLILILIVIIILLINIRAFLGRRKK